MTKLELQYPLGATPLGPDELDGLIPKYITTRGELNELEHKNIQEAILWVRGRKAFEVTELEAESERRREYITALQCKVVDGVRKK